MSHRATHLSGSLLIKAFANESGASSELTTKTMSTDNQTVETKVEGAVAQPENVETPTSTEVDYEAVLAEKDAEIAKIRGEKENYRRGMLKAKGKLPDEDDNSVEELDAKVSRLVEEKLLSRREEQAQAEKDKFITDLARKNKELTLALKNRGQITTTSGIGSNEDKPEVKDNSFFSKDQITSLKAKGWSDAKIETFKQNLAKGTQAPK